MKVVTTATMNLFHHECFIRNFNITGVSDAEVFLRQ